jgi:hypothetical protein
MLFDRKIAHLGTAEAYSVAGFNSPYDSYGSKWEELALSICCPLIRPMSGEL